MCPEMAFNIVLLIISVLVDNVSSDFLPHKKLWNEIQTAMTILQQNPKDPMNFVEQIILQLGGEKQYNSLLENRCPENRQLPRNETLGEFVRKNGTVIERFVKMRSCGKDLSIDNYDQISIIAVVAALHLDMFVCEQVHRFREIYRLNREVNVKNLMSAVRLRQKCHQLDDSNSMLLAYKNSLQCLNVRMVESEMAEFSEHLQTSTFSRFSLLTDDELDLEETFHFFNKYHGHHRRSHNHFSQHRPLEHPLIPSHVQIEAFSGHFSSQNLDDTRPQSKACQYDSSRYLRHPLFQRLTAFSAILASAVLRGVRIYDDNMSCPIEYLDYISKQYGIRGSGFTVNGIERIISQIHPGAGLSSWSHASHHHSYPHSWYNRHNHGKREALFPNIRTDRKAGDDAFIHHGKIRENSKGNGQNAIFYKHKKRTSPDRPALFVSDERSRDRPNSFSSKEDGHSSRCRGQKSRDSFNVVVSNNSLNFSTVTTTKDIIKLGGNEFFMSKSDFILVCPAILYSLLQRAEQKNESVTVDTGTKPTTMETYGLGTLSVFIISMVSMIGALFVKVTRSKVKDYMMGMMLSLSVGCLIGDAVLHLIAEILEEDSDHSDNHSIKISGSLTKQCAVLASIYAFFLLELTFSILRQRGSPIDEVVQQNADNNSILLKEHGKTSLVFMVIIGDAIHNFADGLAIGAAFTQDITVGLSTSIAVFCHELPHELGDFAALINSGLTVKKAILLNFASSLTAFLGLYIGIIASSNDVARSWIFAAGAGMFIYIALANLVPEVLEYFRKTTNLCMFLSLNFGLLLGYVSMLLLAIYESDIKLPS